jgi:5'-nucleotidase
MRIVLTNDDGIEAPGLTALADAVACLGGRAIVVAPCEPHSGCGHRVTTDRPLRLRQFGTDRWGVEGTPADCVRLALARLASDAQLVVSGINRGGNLGADIHHSGTVAAAREAALQGCAALAASQYHRRDSEIDWNRAADWLATVLRTLPVAAPLERCFWNVNLPDLPPGAHPPSIVECPVDASPFQLGYHETPDGWRYAASYHERPRMTGGDVDICFGGAISVSRVGVV